MGWDKRQRRQGAREKRRTGEPELKGGSWQEVAWARELRRRGAEEKRGDGTRRQGDKERRGDQLRNTQGVFDWGVRNEITES